MASVSVLVAGLSYSLTAAIPIFIASGGAGSLEHLADVLEKGGADAVLAASIFHFGKFTVDDAKDYLAGRGIPVRRRQEAAKKDDI